MRFPFLFFLFIYSFLNGFFFKSSYVKHQHTFIRLSYLYIVFFQFKLLFTVNNSHHIIMLNSNHLLWLFIQINNLDEHFIAFIIQNPFFSCNIKRKLFINFFIVVLCLLELTSVRRILSEPRRFKFQSNHFQIYLIVAFHFRLNFGFRCYFKGHRLLPQKRKIKLIKYPAVFALT